MSLILNEYRSKLITHILQAKSQHEVSSLIDAAIKALEQNRVHGHIIVRFVDKTLFELSEFSPMNNHAQHWSNIKIALILFTRIKKNLNASVN